MAATLYASSTPLNPFALTHCMYERNAIWCAHNFYCKDIYMCYHTFIFICTYLIPGRFTLLLHDRNASRRKISDSNLCIWMQACIYTDLVLFVKLQLLFNYTFLSFTTSYPLGLINIYAQCISAASFTKSLSASFWSSKQEACLIIKNMTIIICTTLSPHHYHISNVAACILSHRIFMKNISALLVCLLFSTFSVFCFVFRIMYVISVWFICSSFLYTSRLLIQVYAVFFYAPTWPLPCIAHTHAFRNPLLAKRPQFFFCDVRICFVVHFPHTYVFLQQGSTIFEALNMSAACACACSYNFWLVCVNVVWKLVRLPSSSHRFRLKCSCNKKLAADAAKKNERETI